MPETFTCEIQSRIRDINQGGHVDNVAALRVVEEARMRFFRLGQDGTAGGGLIAAAPTHVSDLVASQRVDYRSEMRFATFQPFVVRMWVGNIGRSSFTVQSEVRLTGPEHPAAVVAETAVVMWSHEQERSWEHEPAMRAALERYRGEPVDLRERPSR